ncbi:hypothetical protein MsAg5_14190 [Methanosarcinaceae archaeon Ag5]|uniref:Uncharacterized protein n=1 Tax=Methanolapillus africanus TaxID=3028297 RepID=A0AAE4SE85_9EURY|nr:hypothetical protein [Methanosarcinaceae archaeon Ag5]
MKLIRKASFVLALLSVLLVLTALALAGCDCENDVELTEFSVQNGGQNASAENYSYLYKNAGDSAAGSYYTTDCGFESASFSNPTVENPVRAETVWHECGLFGECRNLFLSWIE